MSKSDSMHIAFPNGGTVPGAVMGGTDRKVGPHEAVRVPRAYGDSLVEDRFAYEVDPAGAKASRGTRQQGTDARGDALKKLQADLVAREVAVRAGEAALSDRQAAVSKAEAEIAAREVDVKDGEAALGDRQAEVSKAEAKIAAREADVKASEEALVVREAAIAKAETDLFEREGAPKKAATDNNG